MPSLWKAGIDQTLHTNINTRKSVVHDYIAGEGWTFREYAKLVLDVDSYKEVDDHLLRLAMKTLRGKKIGENLFHKEPIVEKKEEIVEEQAVKLPDNFYPIQGNSIGAKRARAYLTRRNIGEDIIKQFNLHFCNEGYYKDRVIIPYYENGELIWWQARSYYDKKRWLNPLNVRKDRIVFNLDALKHGACILTEGVWDAITADGQAVMGTELHLIQLKKILQYHPAEILLAFDPDKAGIQAFQKAARKILDEGYDKLRVFINPTGKDLDELGRAKFQELKKDNVFKWGTEAEARLLQALGAIRKRERKEMTL